MSSTISKLLLLITLCSCSRETLYDRLKNQAPGPVSGTRDVLVFLYSPSECSGCNRVISELQTRAIPPEKIPYANRLVVMKEVRPVEIPVYRERLAYLSPQPALVLDSRLYTELKRSVSDAADIGGFCIIDPHGRIVCASTYSDEKLNMKLRAYNSRDAQ